MGNKKQTPRGRLDTYRAKRSTESTPEPFGGPGDSRPRLFVVQKHDATRLHYDFRLEWNGTLMSWAVPKGPSMDPDNKRFAAQVEDHPVEYADFEGVIPKGNYGAGPVIVWDKGLWIPLDDPNALEETGKLHMMLHGYKLRGEWILIRLQGKDWLLRKKPDAWATKEVLFGEESVHSGLSLDEVRDGQSRAKKLRAALKKHKAPQRHIDVMKVPIPLAETAEAPFSDAEWIFELKYDGYRILAQRTPEAQPRLRSRNGHDLTATFPEVARALKSFPYADLIVDGEIVVLDENGKPDFGLLQKRAKLTRLSDIERAAVERPATYFVFDLLGFEGTDVRPLPLIERKKLLQPLLPTLGPIRYADHVVERGRDMFEQIEAMGIEGIMAKKASAAYGSGRVRVWLKVVADRSDDFVICGFTSPKGSRSGFGALHVGIHVNGSLVYAGRVGTGFDDAQLQEYRQALEQMSIDKPPCADAPASGKEHTWVRPEWVAEVRYKEVTSEGRLRAPVFVRMRDDKQPSDCIREAAEDTDETPQELQAVAASIDLEAPPARPRLQFTNTDKVFFPEDGYSKGDLIAYYEAVAPRILPYLINRPLVLTRYPDGIHGKSFYQKNAPDFVPEWIRRAGVWSESSQREIEYFVCDDTETLLYIANMGAIPLHIWSSRVDSLQHPDFCIIDLDPKVAPFADVITLALATRDLCEEIGLPNYVKTTGSSGLHVLIPLGRQCTFEQSRMLGQLISRVLEAEHHDIATTARHMASRKGRVYLDYLQNRHGQLIVAPYCVRPFPGAPVSAPLEWSEVNRRLTPRKWTIRNLARRLKRKPVDPMLPLLEDKPDLVGALARLAERLAS